MYCKTCGKQVSEGTIICDTCGRNINEGTTYCPNCGHYCMPGDTNCIQCNFELTKNLGQNSFNQSNSNNIGAMPPPISLEEQKEAEFGKKYCRNCGLKIDAQSLRCPYCDSVVNSSTNYCPKCGMGTMSIDKSCNYCGTTFDSAPNLNEQKNTQNNTYKQNPPQFNQPNYAEPNQYKRPNDYVSAPPPVYQTNKYNININNNRGNCSFIVTLLLCFFLGYFGVHRFYTKNYIAGIIQLLTGGGCGIWWLVDLIIILVDCYHDGDGKLLNKDNI
ncbi:MAG: NINE protein [Bacteroidales bacterium]|nr:NINE protein [Bacteroidales bacterium]